MKKYKFIINSINLNNRNRRFLEWLKAHMSKINVVFSYEYTKKASDAEKIAKNAVRKGYDVIVACGGDGTIRDVVNGMVNSDAVLGILPFGTSNDFAKHLGLKNIEKAAESLFNGRKIKIDLGLAELSPKNKKIYFCSTSGIGFDAKLLMLNNRKYFLLTKKLIGNIAYILFGFLLLFSYSPNNAVIKFPKKSIKLRLFMLNVNFVKQMSGMKVTPHADVCNGVFDIFISEEASLLKKISAFLWYRLIPKKINFREVNYISKNQWSDNRFNLSNLKNLLIGSDKKIEVQLNGDFVGYTPVKLSIFPASLEVLVAKDKP
ncbi:diacylglycerol kinase family lipid kinase [Candidatus Woesearchaeota archaeon]|nr:diacylglycerol kinase family lipid kinase [Candidatus Woesearchaeota archaeon]